MDIVRYSKHVKIPKFTCMTLGTIYRSKLMMFLHMINPGIGDKVLKDRLQWFGS